MARIRGRRCARSRVFGPIDLTIEPLEKKCKKHNIPPGQHGQKRLGVKSEYAKQLHEKQKAKSIYGVLEKQFRNYYKDAASSKGATGTILLQLLESRLDNIVYRMGFASTRAEARQLVSHRSVMVNGSIVNIPSYRVGAGNMIEIKERSKAQGRIQAALQLSSQRKACEWLDVDTRKVSGVFKTVPDATDLTASFDAHLIVEFYSK
jgi:small subunit ribosomal protein S4